MSNAWNNREAEHVAELDRVKRKAFLDGREEGLRVGRGENQGLEEDGAEERASGIATGITGRVEYIDLPRSVALYLEVSGQTLEGGAEVLGWSGQGDPAEYILNFQRDSDAD